MHDCTYENEIENLEIKIDELTNEFRKYSKVHLINGGGRGIEMERIEFDQMIYDRPKEALNNVVSASDKIGKIVDAVFKIGVLIVVIIQFLK